LIIKAVEQEYELQAGMLNIHTILKRVQRNNVSGKLDSTTSPLAEMEPLLVEYCICLARIVQPLTKDLFTCLAISMIKGTSIEEKVRLWKMTFSHFNDTQGLLRAGWYHSFIKRNRFILSQM
jgi:hypothetical protein